MKIGIIQQHNTPDVVNNKKRLAAAIRSVAGNGAQLVVLQELHNSLYFCQEERVDLFDLAEPIPGPSTAFYGDLARELGVDSDVLVRASCGRPLSQHGCRYGA